MGDARGHAPTLGQTRKRRWRPWGKMAPLGLKAVVGESECVCWGLGAGGQGCTDPGAQAAGAGQPGWASST